MWTWVWIAVFCAACVIPMTAYVYFIEIRESGDRRGQVDPEDTGHPHPSS
jgi:hypothetical protein